MATDRREVTLRWTGEGDAFTGGRDGSPEIAIDGSGETGPSPMETLLLSVAGCMGIDVLMILEKGRVPVEELTVRVGGDRADDPPRRFTSLSLDYTIRGPGDEHEAKIQRAIDLSRDTYCSVLHTLRPDLELEITFGLD